MYWHKTGKGREQERERGTGRPPFAKYMAQQKMDVTHCWSWFANPDQSIHSLFFII